jgi:hypothetical protein
VSQGDFVIQNGASARDFIQKLEILRARLLDAGLDWVIRLTYKSDGEELVEQLLPYVHPSKPHFLLQGRLDLEKLKRAASHIANVGAMFNANCEYAGGSWLLGVGRDQANLRFLSLRSLGGGELPKLNELVRAAGLRGIIIGPGQSSLSDGIRCRASLGALSQLSLRETTPEARSFEELIAIIVEWLSGALKALGGVKTWPADGRRWILEGHVRAEPGFLPFAGFEFVSSDLSSNVELYLLPQLGEHIDKTAAASLGVLELLTLTAAGEPLGAIHFSWQLGASEVRWFGLGKNPAGSADVGRIVKDFYSK